MSPSSVKLIILNSLGGALEYFDFAIYALFAIYLRATFFPHADPLIGLLNIFAIFAVGYLARPIGGMLFSHFGDRYGRKAAFQISIFIMTIATFLTGCLPSYHQLGIVATLLLVLLRIAQGISLGGEVPGATIFTLEHVYSRRGMAVGLIFMSITLGNVLASLLAYSLSTLFSQAQMNIYGWRIGFIIGSLIGIIGYILRRKFSETPLFMQFIQEQQKNNLFIRVPLFALFKRAKVYVFIGIGLICLVPVNIFLIISLPSYASTILHRNIQQSYLITIYMFSLLAIFCALFGYLSDFLGRKRLLIMGVFSTILMGYLWFYALNSGSLTFIWISSGLYVFGFAMYNGTYACALAELFDTGIRYTGMAFCYNISFALFMSISPVMNTYLFKITNDAFAPYYFLVIVGLLTILVCLQVPSRIDKKVLTRFAKLDV